MPRKTWILSGMCILFQTLSASAGIEWQAQIVAKEKNKEKTTVIRAYAQDGNVREEFVEVPKDENPLQAEGTYWLYKGESDMVYVVNPKEKSYMEIPVNSLLQIAGALSAIVKITITNPEVAVIPLPNTTVANLPCEHVMIKTAYDMETKIAIIKTKNHINQANEIWATDAVSAKEFSAAFKGKSYKTGHADLDMLIEKQMAAQKKLGFIVKSIMTTKTTDKKGKETIDSTEMNVIGVSEKKLDKGLFEIPKDFKKSEFIPAGT